ncbi:hypothetical protein [Candidatus Nitrosocosmicus arcticus]|uniref:Uncharacterized protein n=1 Tax=Candidatus Nitrosocosmicus arcticus TaxID=2035267 RepID=A0A557SUA1_9ARCH|nr:hypothetical protein [Candidatus Nitrosocosmicus arcticus]TVP40175.1 hypothetical protein NARC_90081 [Candidatus Nitrosocosmicus arcticus]
MDTFDVVKIGIDVVIPIVKEIWESYNSKLSQELDFIELKTNELAIQNKTYTLLYHNIFLPLRVNIISSIETCYFIPIIEFDPLFVRGSDYWEEGYLHLKNDIANFDSRFSWIENNIKEYNSDLEKFERDERKELVANYFEENRFFVTDEVSRNPSNNTIIVRTLLERLKNYWKSKEDFRLVWENELLKINGVEIIASITSEDKTKIENGIEYLKNSDIVLRKYYDLAGYYNKIKEEAEGLSKKIGSKVIIKIEKGTYKTTCKDCLN